MSSGAADDHDHGRPRMGLDEAELEVERAADGEEQIEVGERADHVKKIFCTA